MGFAVVTPARNEAENLGPTFATIASQSMKPDLWVVVNDSSTDGTFRVASTISQEHDWVRVMDAKVNVPPGADRTFVLFEKAARDLKDQYGLLMKLDADTRLPKKYVESMTSHFQQNERLGIASGVNSGEWTLGFHLRGNNRVYRRRCLDELAFPEGGVGWDTVDRLVAERRRWNSEVFRDLVCTHTRSRVDDTRYSLRLGRISRALGYFPWYMALRSVASAVKQTPTQGVALWVGFALGGLGSVEPWAVRLVREDQVNRVREAIRRKQPQVSVAVRTADADA